jgi:hypothetical protein
MVNVKPIHARLLAERGRLERAAQRGDLDLPDFGHDQGIPLWFVIQKLLDRRDRHRLRQVRYRQRQRMKKAGL